ncbi:DUF4252 domain-containing protein [Parabacteroides sp. OttesenSCG-928-N08]|nr:DUF4252 domain-containing protein [Parabacteroides sp. OttesenSCG-928-N08]
MRRRIILSALLVVLVHSAFGQYKVKDLFSEFARSSDSESIQIGKIGLTFAGLFTDTMGVEGLEVFSFDEAGEETKSRFIAAVKQLKDKDYETMISHNEEGGRTRVLVKIEKELIREMVIVTSGTSNALIRVKGKIKPEDIQRVVDNSR